MDIRHASPEAKRKLAVSLSTFSSDDIYFYMSKVKEFNAVVEYDGNGDKISTREAKLDGFIYAHLAHKVGELIDHGPDEDLVKQVIGKVLTHFADNYFSVAGKQEEIGRRVSHIGKVITIQFRDRISIFGVIHCLDLLSNGVPPFDTDLYGFDTMRIVRTFGQYTRECQTRYSDWMTRQRQQDAEHMNLAERAALAGKLIDNAPPQWREKFKEQKDRLRAKELQWESGDDLPRRFADVQEEVDFD